jgi:transcriptional regulator with XRE-family HTH domain
VISFIRLERLKRGWRQQDLWSQTGISQWRISLIENGMPPKPEERKRLAEVFGIPEQEVDLRIGAEG